MKPYQRLALDRIRILFREAAHAFSTHPTRSHRYVHLARKIAMKAKIKIPHPLTRSYCHHCSAYLQPGTTSRVRTREGKLVIFCTQCAHYTRIPLQPKTKQPAPPSR